MHSLGKTGCQITGRYQLGREEGECGTLAEQDLAVSLWGGHTFPFPLVLGYHRHSWPQPHQVTWPACVGCTNSMLSVKEVKSKFSLILCVGKDNIWCMKKKRRSRERRRQIKYVRSALSPLFSIFFCLQVTTTLGQYPVPHLISSLLLLFTIEYVCP